MAASWRGWGTARLFHHPPGPRGPPAGGGGGRGAGPGYGLLPVITCCRFGDLIDSIVVLNRIVWVM